LLNDLPAVAKFLSHNNQDYTPSASSKNGALPASNGR
jgi:hypothetical protein